MKREPSWRGLVQGGCRAEGRLASRRAVPAAYTLHGAWDSNHRRGRCRRGVRRLARPGRCDMVRAPPAYGEDGDDCSWSE